MAARRDLERLCKSDEINQSRSDTVYGVLKDVPGRLFADISTRIYQHANQHGRDTILRALSLSAAHLELDKLFCPVQDEEVNEIFDVLALVKFNRKKENADGDIRRAQDALWPRLSPPKISEDYSPTPDPAEMRIVQWVSNQNTLPPDNDRPSEYIKNQKRRYSDIESNECDSTHIGNALPEKKLQGRVGTRRQPKRSCKSTRATQSAIRCGEWDHHTRKIAGSEAPQHSKEGIFKSTTRSGDIGSRRTFFDKGLTSFRGKTECDPPPTTGRKRRKVGAKDVEIDQEPG